MGSVYIVHVRVSFIKVLKWWITEAINKLNEAITAKLDNNKDEIIQSLKNEVPSL